MATNDLSSLTTLERAMVEFYEADSIDDIRWANGDYDKHGRYLCARWLGMEKLKAHHWANTEWSKL